MKNGHLTPSTQAHVLCDDVVSALDGHKTWAGLAGESGLVSPVQFLAVALWAVASLQRRELSKTEECEVVTQWWERLANATARRVAQLGGGGSFRPIVPLESVTLLELQASKVTSAAGWCISAENADTWLQGLGYGAWFKAFFGACEQPVIGSKSDPATAWTGERLAAEQAALKVQGRAQHFNNFTERLSKTSGLSAREITRRIKEWNDSQSTGRPVSTVFKLGRALAPKTRANTGN